MKTVWNRNKLPYDFERKCKSFDHWQVYIKRETCGHPLPHHTVVVFSAVGCEDTVEVCPTCGKHLTEPETDC